MAPPLYFAELLIKSVSIMLAYPPNWRYAPPNSEEQFSNREFFTSTPFKISLVVSSMSAKMAPPFLVDDVLIKLQLSMVAKWVSLSPMAPAVFYANRLMNFEFEISSEFFSQYIAVAYLEVIFAKTVFLMLVLVSYA